MTREEIEKRADEYALKEWGSLSENAFERKCCSEDMAAGYTAGRNEAIDEAIKRISKREFTDMWDRQAVEKILESLKIH